ncbi:MAG: thioredoxin domain-containing protein [Pseudanabaenaceae cyanobacterium SKYGB_i_bin29]|nr:thioredoxin domain-containing protein [Pseudanabaenaceae cyanobacterium SKYG29]MDW8421534.1 thioredoxin domain-containing protein [Pseudanabaenaceae cyanobacterium SKYGB_i_bin29]
MRLVGRLILLVVLAFCTWGCAQIGGGNKISDAELEAKVVEVIKKNPQVILESVQKYQEEQARAQIQQRFQQVVGQPTNIIRQSPTTGSPDRKIVLAEFSDFQCPYCARAHTTVKQFMEKHKNEVTLTYKHFPLQSIHPEALPAAKASWAAQQQNKFWEFHDQLFTQQQRLGEGFYVELAQNLGLDVDKFNQDRQSQVAEDAVVADFNLGRELGIQGTPAFFMNDRFLSGAVSLQELEQLLAEVKK